MLGSMIGHYDDDDRILPRTLDFFSVYRRTAVVAAAAPLRTTSSSSSAAAAADKCIYRIIIALLSASEVFISKS
uniref:Uncharacterized protein n=1 Tax=Syphacia muris TaxID=451379 RepID=A0A0N5A9N5_9BILA